MAGMKSTSAALSDCSASWQLVHASRSHEAHGRRSSGHPHLSQLHGTHARPGPRRRPAVAPRRDKLRRSCAQRCLRRWIALAAARAPMLPAEAPPPCAYPPGTASVVGRTPRLQGRPHEGLLGVKLLENGQEHRGLSVGKLPVGIPGSRSGGDSRRSVAPWKSVPCTRRKDRCGGSRHIGA